MHRRFQKVVSATFSHFTCTCKKSTDSYIPCLLLISIHVKKCHTKVNVDHVQDFDVKNTPVEA